MQHWQLTRNLVYLPSVFTYACYYACIFQELNMYTSTSVIPPDSSEIEARQLAVDAHRRRLQAEFDRKAAIHAEKQAEVIKLN